MKKVVLAGVLVAVGLFITVVGNGTAHNVSDCLQLPNPNVFIWGD